MYERIVIPLDGSQEGEAALPYVEALVDKLSPEVEVEITLLQVLSQPDPVSLGDGGLPFVVRGDKQLEDIEKQALGYLGRTGKPLRDKGVTIITKVRIGDAAEQIKKEADDINADLIAMSTHGRSGLSRLAFGSVAEKVLRGENKPILMVRATK
jgi:nucleotide-binding universal stress UspA family protein